MRNSPITPIPIILDKQRNLIYTNYANMRFELEYVKVFGVKLTMPIFIQKLQVEESISLIERLGVTELLLLFWAGLVQEDKSLTLDYVAEHTVLSDYNDIWPKILEAYVESAPQQKKEEIEENLSGDTQKDDAPLSQEHTG